MRVSSRPLAPRHACSLCGACRARRRRAPCRGLCGHCARAQHDHAARRSEVAVALARACHPAERDLWGCAPCGGALRIAAPHASARRQSRLGLTHRPAAAPADFTCMGWAGLAVACRRVSGCAVLRRATSHPPGATTALGVQLRCELARRARSPANGNGYAVRVSRSASRRCSVIDLATALKRMGTEIRSCTRTRNLSAGSRCCAPPARAAALRRLAASRCCCPSQCAALATLSSCL